MYTVISLHRRLSSIYRDYRKNAHWSRLQEECSLSPFLKTGVLFAIFKIDGKSQSTQSLKKSQI